MKEFLLNLQFILRPAYWMLNREYSEQWDRVLNQLLDEYKLTDIGSHHATLGPTTIWITNVPYACMNTYQPFMQKSR